MLYVCSGGEERESSAAVSTKRDWWEEVVLFYVWRVVGNWVQCIDDDL